MPYFEEMRTMWRRLPGGWLLSGTVPDDAHALVKHLADGQVARWLLRVPHPYEPSHARQFLAAVADEEKRIARTVQFAIRDPEGALVGLVGLSGLPPVHETSPKPVELGFWVAPSHWKKGIATAAVARVVSIALVEYEVDHLVASVLDGNSASEKVLRANRFEVAEAHVDIAAAVAGAPGPRWGSRYTLSYERYEALEKQAKA